MPADSLNTFLALLTIGGQIFIAILLLTFFSAPKNPFVRFVKKHALLLSFLVALTSSLFSLTYSDLIGFDPCKLCWFQRIFMYPLAIILGLALLKRDEHIVDYAYFLSLFGGVIALYHYYGQMFMPSALPCGVVGLTPSCSQRFFLEFGYITIPLMSLTAFLAIFVFMSLKRAGKNS